MLTWIELGLACACLLLVFLIPRSDWPWMLRAEGVFRRIAQRPVLSVILVGAIAICARVAVLPVLPQPEPTINDEFSFLLAADTFAQCRMTNPAHPMGIHFENLHVIQQPTYASMYPPAQSVFLAFGQIVTGKPFVGVCLSVALCCAAICWMLQGWTSPSFALLGGLLAVARFGMFSYWANSYWGGAPAALGGALVLGALPRMKTLLRPGPSVLMGLGLAILANSRPYEGLVLSIPVGVSLLLWLRRSGGPEFRRAIVQVVLPLVLILILAASVMGYYFWRVTGNPLRMPQMVDRVTYAVAPYFFWQSLRPEPVYHHPSLRAFYTGTELSFYKENRSVTAVVALTVVKTFDVWLFYLAPLLTLPMVLGVIAAPRKLSWGDLDGETRFLLVVVATSLFGVALEVFFFPHYEAPLACVLLALVVRATQHTRPLRWRGRSVGLFLSRAVPLACLALVVLRVAAGPLHVCVGPDWPPTWYNSVATKTSRARVQAQLEKQPGKQLVLVRYATRAKSRNQWVYNRADIDAAKVVWAWDMGEAQNRELLNYYKDRRVWHVDPDREGDELSMD